MAYTYRTLFRHLFVVFVLLAFPLVLAPFEQVLWWYQRHWLFFTVLFFASAFLGRQSDLWVRQATLKTHLEKARLPLPNEAAKTEERNFYWELALRWASCSRCVSWWTGGFLALVWSLFYWEWRETWWHNLIPWVLFSSLGASLAAVVSVGVYFFRRHKKSP